MKILGKKSLLLFSGLVTMGQQADAWGGRSDRPNVLIILLDDAGYNDFGFMGSPDLRTPNIDALAADGVIFTDGHVAATVSSPSRACLMTGRYGHRFGYECNPDHSTDGLPLDEQTLGEIFKEAGYHTVAIGKWHLGSRDEQHPNRRGFDLFYGMKAGSRGYFYDEIQSDKPGDGRNLLLNEDQVKFDGYLTDVFSCKAVDFIKETKEPFMMYLAYNAVHTPMQATQEDMALFEGHPRQKLAAMTHALDRGIGCVVRALKESGKYDNTLIFFLSDNGGATNNQSSNHPLKGFKGNKFEGGHRVPFFMVWRQGSVLPGQYDGLVSSLDIFATAVAAAGIRKTKKPLDGVSLLPYVSGKKKGNPHEELYWRKMDTRAIRCGDYKLIVTQGVDSVLYDVRKDMQEQVDIKEAKPEVFHRLYMKLARWEREECVAPLWIEEGWAEITNGYHRQLMHNEIKTARDLQKTKGKK